MADIELVDALGQVGYPCLPFQAVTTSAATTNIALSNTARVIVVNVTTDGSGLTRTLNLPNPTFDIDGNGNASLVDQLVIINVVSTVDPADLTQLTANGGSTLAFYKAGMGSLIQSPSINVKLNDGATIALRWCFDTWYIDNDLTDGFFNGTYVDNNVTYGAGLSGGVSADGGNTTLSAGRGDDTRDGNGGDVILSPGSNNGGNGRHGLVILGAGVELPTADPHVVRALWNSAGTVKISAG
jgi:hypothetical protein